MKKPLLLFLSLLFLSGCQRPKGFTLKKVTSYHSPSPKWETTTSISEKELFDILDQPYTYLGSGNHTYAFVSQDGLYVMKFFKQKHMRTQGLFLSSEKLKKRAQEREESYVSYKIAYEHLKEETGTIYLHLNKTDHIGMTLTLIDQEKNPTQINLDEMEFLIQKKGVLAFEHLGNLIRKKAYDEMFHAVTSLLQVVAKRNQKGIYDKDLQFFKNFGFLGNHAIEIDIGEFKWGEEVPNVYEELTRLSYQIREFVREEAPDFAPKVESMMNKEISKYR